MLTSYCLIVLPSDIIKTIVSTESYTFQMPSWGKIISVFCNKPYTTIIFDSLQYDIRAWNEPLFKMTLL